MELSVGTSFSSEWGRMLDKPLVLSFIGDIAQSKADAMPSARKRTESRLEVFTGFSSDRPCDCAHP